MSKFEDLTGMKFGKLTAIKRVENSKSGQTRWLCRCDCGNEVIVRAADLKNEHTISCGCERIKQLIECNTTHGMTNTSIYHTWENMMSRCYNPKHKKFDEYGGRGIKVCPQWHKFINFYNDVSKLENYGRAGYTLDRINNDGDYCPENVRWADINTQARNKRNNILVEYEGVEMCLTEAAEKSGINYQTLISRYKHGDRGDDLFKPARKLTKK